jgi:hypothetical protein
MNRRTAAVATLVPSILAALVATDATATTTARQEVAPATLVVVDRATQAGVRGPRLDTYGAVPVDFNRDGHQDVWVGRHGDGAALFRNDGAGRYTRVARSAWPDRNRAVGHIDRHDCDWADVDRNGLPDAYCATGRMPANLVKRGRDNELWLQVRRGGFREVGSKWGIGDVCGRGRDVEFLDVNGDRFPDLFLGNEVARQDPDDPCNARGNRLPNEASKVYINQRGNGFKYAPKVFGFGAGAGNRCAVSLDFNRDGWEDLLACRGRDQRPRLFRNARGRFVDVTSRHGLVETVHDAEVADLDRDGDADIVTASADGFAYHAFQGATFGRPVTIGTLASGAGGSVAVGDVDGDGDRDVYGLGWQLHKTNPDDVLLINDRMAFTPLPVPAETGSGDEVVALHPRTRGPRTLFLVLNGHLFGRSPDTFVPGRTQLITVARR